MLTSALRESPHTVIDYQKSIDNLCAVINNINITDRALDIFFSAHPKLENVDGRDSKDKLRPIQTAALKGNSVAFRYLIEVKNASLATDRLRDNNGDFVLEMNIIEYVGQDEVNQDIKKYIWEKKLWRKFTDPTFLEVYALAWCGQIVRTMHLLTDTNLRDSEQDQLLFYITELREPSDDDAPIIEHLAKLKSLRQYRLATTQWPDLYGFANESEEDESLSGEDDQEEGLSAQQKNTNAFCKLAADEEKNPLDLALFISTLSSDNFNIDARHTETKVRAVECAAEKGSFESFKYLIEALNANIAYDSDMPVASLMNLISTKDTDKTAYYLTHKLWEKQKDGTTELHAYAWAGDFEKVRQLVCMDNYSIFATNEDGQSVLDWAYFSKNSQMTEFLFGTIEVIFNECADKHFSDTLRDLSVLKATYYGNINLSQESIEAYIKALHYHRHATIDNSRASEDKLYRDLSKQFYQASIDLLKPFPIKKGAIEIYDKLELTTVIYNGNKYSLDTLDAIYKKSIIYQKEAMRSAHVVETKTPTDKSDFIIYRKNVVHQYINLSLLYNNIGQLFKLNKLFSEALSAFQHCKQAIDEAMMIAYHFANRDYYFYYGPDSPPPDPDLIKELIKHLDDYQKKIATCSHMALIAAPSPTHNGFTIFKKAETIPTGRTHLASGSNFFTLHHR